MYIDFSALFHQSSKDLNDKGTVNIPSDLSKWPESWKTIDYKTYERLPKIALSGQGIDGAYASVVEKRHSVRTFTSKPVSMNGLSAFLRYSCGRSLSRNEGDYRQYASGGARYPIEIYPVVFAGSKEIPAGVYHYNVQDHALDVMWQRSFSKSQIDELFVYDWIHKASFVVFMTCVFGRTQIKYGERGYRYALLEAGHISQNMYLSAAAAGLDCCAMGGVRDDAVEQLLDIDGVSESVIHSLVLGTP